jgi:roadblock/LC7 domain-containing protein
MTDKTVNYTDHMAGLLMNGYTGTDNATEVPELAALVGKSEKSVVSKLGSMCIYVAATKAKTAGSYTKTQIVGSIGTMVELNEADLEGLAKATKTALIKVHNVLQAAKTEVEVEAEVE